MSSISTVYEKGILLINYPESFIKEFIVLLFFYKGAKSSIDERAAAAMLTDQMDKKLGGIATQVCGWVNQVTILPLQRNSVGPIF